jgi:hypothetical protein
LLDGPGEIEGETSEERDEKEERWKALPERRLQEAGTADEEEESDRGGPWNAEHAGAAHYEEAGAVEPPPGGGERLAGEIESGKEGAGGEHGAGELHQVWAGFIEIIPDEGMNAVDEESGRAEALAAAKEVMDGKEAKEEEGDIGGAQGELRYGNEAAQAPDVEHVEGELDIRVVLVVKALPPGVEGGCGRLEGALCFINPEALRAESHADGGAGEEKEPEGAETEGGGHAGREDILEEGWEKKIEIG